MTTDPDQKDRDRLALIIQLTNILETRMKHVISLYSKIPADRIDFFHSHITNNSIISFGAKMKLVFAIAKEVKIPIDKNNFHVVSSRRNAFAHQDPVNSIRLSESSAGDTNVNVTFVVESLKGTGELETITREQAYMEFMRAHMKAERNINTLLKAITEHNRSTEPARS